MNTGGTHCVSRSNGTAPALRGGASIRGAFSLRCSGGKMALRSLALVMTAFLLVAVGCGGDDDDDGKDPMGDSGKGGASGSSSAGMGGSQSSAGSGGDAGGSAGASAGMGGGSSAGKGGGSSA